MKEVKYDWYIIIDKINTKIITEYIENKDENEILKYMENNFAKAENPFAIPTCQFNPNIQCINEIKYEYKYYPYFEPINFKQEIIKDICNIYNIEFTDNINNILIKFENKLLNIIHELEKEGKQNGRGFSSSRLKEELGIKN